MIDWKNLKISQFTKLEINKISESLLNQLTNKIINPKDGLWKIDENKIDTLKKKEILLKNHS